MIRQKGLNSGAEFELQIIYANAIKNRSITVKWVKSTYLNCINYFYEQINVVLKEFLY